MKPWNYQPLPGETCNLMCKCQQMPKSIYAYEKSCAQILQTLHQRCENCFLNNENFDNI